MQRRLLLASLLGGLFTLFTGPALAEEPVPPPWPTDAAALQARLQGAWVVDGGKWAFRFAGAVMTTTHDGKKEETRPMTIEAPCQLALAPDASGGSEVYLFAFENDKLHWEMLGSGVKKSDGSIIACMLSGVFVYKNGSCQAYTKPFGEWRAEPGARCTLQGATFRVTDPYGVKGALTLVGDGKLVPDPGKALFATKVKDWSEAKAKVQKKWAAPPPPR